MCGGFIGTQCCDGLGLRCYAEDMTIGDWTGKCVKGCRQKGEACGGFAGIGCCATQHCHITEKHPDAMGKCV